MSNKKRLIYAGAVLLAVILIITEVTVFVKTIGAPVIGKVTTTDASEITVDGYYYELDTSGTYSRADKGRFIGKVQDAVGSYVLRIYRIKDADGYVFATNEYGDKIYKIKTA